MAHYDLNDDWLFTPVWTEAFGRGDPASSAAGGADDRMNPSAAGGVDDWLNQSAAGGVDDRMNPSAAGGIDDQVLSAATGWQRVRLPHTCREVPFHYFDESLYQMVCGYRRVIRAPKDWKGKRVFLTIGAAGHSAEVYLNGTFLNEHHCGYTAFTTELTDHLVYGADNILSVKVNSREDQDIPPFGYVIDYMTYGGLYREVSLEVKEKVYLEDIFAKPYVREGRHGPLFVESFPESPLRTEDSLSGQIVSEITIDGKWDIPGRELCFRQRLLPYENDTAAAWSEKDAADILAEPLAVCTTPVDDCKTGMKTWHGKGHIVRMVPLDVPEVKLWTLRSPTLYTLRTELISVLAERPKTVLTAVHKALRGESTGTGSDASGTSGRSDVSGGARTSSRSDVSGGAGTSGRSDTSNVAEATLTGLLSSEFDADEIVLDVRDEVIGFRTIEFRKDGFYLNGAKTKFVGLNRHQSWPYVGYAMPASQQKLDAEIAKYDLGLNALRSSHYPQSPHFMKRCDELGLLIFTEAPGWQHIGGSAWKEQGLRNIEDMILQNRNHPCVFLWGTRINESVDDDDFYEKTARCARSLDPTRPISGVRCYKKSHLIEDVYAYNDFSHDGTNAGCEKKKAVTDDMNKAYFVSECNGHMFPTKSFDNEDTRLSQAIRHATVMDAVLGEPDIAGLYEWCLFDYNTHRDFGSGDRICYHGVLDMFRNPKTAAAVYASQQDETPYLEISSLMAMGEHPSGNPGQIYIFTNADEVRFYKNDRLVTTFAGKPASKEEAEEAAEEAAKAKPGIKFSRSIGEEGERWPNLKHPPILIDQYISDEMEEKEGFTHEQAEAVKDLLNYAAVHGFDRLPAYLKAKAAKMMLKYRMTFEDAYRLYGAYIGSWGKASTTYRFEAIKDGRVVKRLIRSATTDLVLEVTVDHTDLVEGATYDVASVRLVMRDQNGTALPFYQGIIHAELTGPCAFYGPGEAVLRGGMGGLYVRTVAAEDGRPDPGPDTEAGESGAAAAAARAPIPATLTLKGDQIEPVVIHFRVFN